MNRSLKEVEEACKKKLRLTKQLRVILNIVYNSDDHPTVDLIFERAHRLSESISKATVYRCVRKLVELGIIEKQDFGFGKFHYEIVTHHHHHLIDTVSGRIVEFSSNELEDLKKKIAKNFGFELINHRLDMYVVPIKDDKEIDKKEQIDNNKEKND